MFGCPLYVWMPLICLDTPCMFGCPHMFGHPCLFGYSPICLGALMFGCSVCLDTPYVWKPPVYLDDVSMPPVHTQHKESMLCHTKGVSIYAHTFGYTYVFGCPLYVCMPPYVWDTLCMFCCTPYVWTQPLYVWMPQYVWTPPYIWMYPICLDTLLYVWTQPLCLDAPSMFGHPMHVWMPPVHIKHKESMLCHTKGVHMPHTFGCPICLDTPCTYG